MKHSAKMKIPVTSAEDTNRGQAGHLTWAETPSNHGLHLTLTLYALRWKAEASITTEKKCLPISLCKFYCCILTMPQIAKKNPRETERMLRWGQRDAGRTHISSKNLHQQNSKWHFLVQLFIIKFCCLLQHQASQRRIKGENAKGRLSDLYFWPVSCLYCP